MIQATWNGAVLAESEDTVVVERNHYFPPEALNAEYFEQSDHRSLCPWKGEASYHDVVVDGEVNRAAAWYYPDPKPAAEKIRGRIAFWHGVRVERVKPNGDGNPDADDASATSEGGAKGRLRRLFGG